MLRDGWLNGRMEKEGWMDSDQWRQDGWIGGLVGGDKRMEEWRWVGGCTETDDG